jgi:hypothetical protein
MPILELFTNLPESKIPPNFNIILSIKIAELLDKPIDYNCIGVTAGQLLYFGDTNNCNPCAIIKLISIGRLGEDYNDSISDSLMRFVEKTLKISPDCVLIHFEDEMPANIGYNMQ